ncbi:MAG: hypothetical protein AAFQ82_01140 [Myxococcota bacterium]
MLNRPTRVIASGIVFLGLLFASSGCATTKSAVHPDLPPDAKPSMQYFNGADHYDIYVFKKDGQIKSKVCIKYRPTGSRIKRDSCKYGPFNRISFLTPDTNSRMRHTFGIYGNVPPIGPHELNQMLAETAQSSLENVLNSRINIIDLDEKPADPEDH